jgi:hypothetical protein
LIVCWVTTTRLRYNPSGSATPRPGHSILLSKLEKLRMCDVSGALNVAFRTLDMPNLRSLTFVATFGSDREMPIDWSAAFHSRSLKRLALKEFPPVALEALLSQTDKLDDLEELNLFPNEPFDVGEFVKGFARKLSKTACCPKLRSLSVSSLLPSAMRAVEEFKRTRESLRVYTYGEDLELE